MMGVGYGPRQEGRRSGEIKRTRPTARIGKGQHGEKGQQLYKAHLYRDTEQTARNQTKDGGGSWPTLNVLDLVADAH